MRRPPPHRWLRRGALLAVALAAACGDTAPPAPAPAPSPYPDDPGYVFVDRTLPRLRFQGQWFRRVGDAEPEAVSLRELAGQRVILEGKMLLEDTEPYPDRFLLGPAYPGCAHPDLHEPARTRHRVPGESVESPASSRRAAVWRPEAWQRHVEDDRRTIGAKALANRRSEPGRGEESGLQRAVVDVSLPTGGRVMVTDRLLWVEGTLEPSAEEGIAMRLVDARVQRLSAMRPEDLPKQ